MEKNKVLWLFLLSLLYSTTVFANDSLPQEETELNEEESVEDIEIIEIEEGFENLGPMINKSSAITSKIAADSNGKYYIYYIMHGTPTALTVVDYVTKEIKNTYILEDSKSAWGLDVDSNGVLWIGGTGETKLYSYDPNLEEFITHLNPFANKSDTSIQDMKIVDKEIFISSAYGGSLVSYNTESKLVIEYGQIRKRKEFLKSVASDTFSNELFLSVGSPIDLLVGDKNKKSFKSFLPSKYASEKFAQDLILTENHIIARLYPSQLALVFDRKTLKQISEFKISSKTISTISPLENAVYYSYNGQLMKFDMEKYLPIELGVYLPKGTEGVTFDYVQNSEPVEAGEVDDYSNWSIVGMVDNNGQIFDYNLTSGIIEYHQFTLPGQPVELYTLASSEDGRTIYTNGYMSGGLGLLDVDSQKNETFTDVSQIESMIEVNQKLFIGAYPLSRLLVYDRTKEWTMTNPNLLISMKSYKQDRTTAVAPMNNGEDIVFGTLPDTGFNGGALAFYNIKTGNFTIHENYIYKQSIVSLVERGNEVYGGSSIHANQMVNPRGARFFVVNKEMPEKLKYIGLPFHSSMITSLIRDRENRIWGMADGKLFVYQNDWTKLRYVEILPLISGRFRNASLIEGNDQYIYGSVEGKFFKVDKVTLEVTTIKEDGVYGLVKDYRGNLYFYNGSSLWKYTIESNRY